MIIRFDDKITESQPGEYRHNLALRSLGLRFCEWLRLPPTDVLHGLAPLTSWQRFRLTIINLLKCAWRPIGSLVLISLLVLPAFSQNAKPATPCRVGVRAPAFGFWAWPAGAQVKVYTLSADFTSEEIPNLLIALVRWDAEWESSGSRVRLEYAGTTATPQKCQNCLTIMRAPVFNKKTRHGSELYAYSEQGNQFVTYASILIDPALTNTRALTNAVAHEVGHSFGLLDCYDCQDRSTVMNKLKRMNTSNDMEGPTSCDLAQVRDAYQQLRLRVGPAPVAMNALVDDGEEPVEDDSPVVVPN